MGRIGSLSKPRKVRKGTSKTGYFCDVYMNDRNYHKFIEVHYYHCGHQSIRQFIADANSFNYTGDGNLHRVSKATLRDILEDYTLESSFHKFQEV